MDKTRLDFLKHVVNTNDPHDCSIKQMHFSVDELKWLIEQAEKVERLQKAINKAIIQADEYYSDNVDADHAIRDMFNALKKALKG